MSQDDDRKSLEVFSEAMPAPQKLTPIKHIERAIAEIVQRPPSLINHFVPGGEERDLADKTRKIQGLTNLVSAVTVLIQKTNEHEGMINAGPVIIETHELIHKNALSEQKIRQKQLKSIDESFERGALDERPHEQSLNAAWRDKQYENIDKELQPLLSARDVILAELNKAEDDEDGATLNLRHRSRSLQKEIDDLEQRRIRVRNQHLDWLQRQED